MQRIGDHHVPSGPLAVRWLALDVPEVHAGERTEMHVELENAGSVTWRALNLSYHWLDERGNPIDWDGVRTPVESAPGERRTVDAVLRGPIPPGTYKLALDLVDENRYWLAELGNHSPTRDVEVTPRDASSARAFVPTDAQRAPDWDERVRAAHEEGYAAVGGSIAYDGGLFRRTTADELQPYAPGGGRNPAFAHPLVCPSLLAPLEPNAEVYGLPAWRPEGDEPWLYDARIALTLPRRSDRRRA